MRIRLEALCFCLIVAVLEPCLLAQTAPSTQPIYTGQPDGGWAVVGPGYAAHINKDGLIDSYQVAGIETLGRPLAYHRNAHLLADQITPVADTLKVHLKGTGEATIDYRFHPEGLTITPTYKGNGYADIRLTASQNLLGIELLNDKSASGGGDAIHFVERGEIRGVPAVNSTRNQMVRLHYPGLALRAYIQAWGAPFNYESAGSIGGYTWGRSLLEANRAFPIVLTIEKVPQPASLPAMPFVPRTDKAASLYYVDEPCTWTIDLGDKKAYQYLLDAGLSSLDLAWTTTDADDRPAAAGNTTVKLDSAAPKLAQPVTISNPGSGYHQVRFCLSDPSGRMLPSSFLTRFTVIHKISGMVNRDDALAGKDYSDYAVVGMIGAGCIRESHDIKGFLTNQEPQGNGWLKVEGAEPPAWLNIKRMDEVINRAVEESARYKLNWFFQANGRPKWATPAIYEAIAYAIVTRYKGRCHAWEVENEPNFGYQPKDYFEQCVIPFHQGAKRADPACIIMGPGTVSMSHTLRFMEYAYASGANQYLDQLTTHTYPGPGESWERFGNISMIQKLRDWMKEHGEGGKPLWQTEQGYNWQHVPKTLAATYSVRQFLTGWRLGILPEHQYYFYPQAHGFESWYVSGGGEQGSERSWLPLAAAQRFFAEATFGMSYVSDITSPYKGIYLSRFTGPQDDLVAAWTFDFPYELTIQAPGLRGITGFMGNPVHLTPDDTGRLVVPLSGRPIYLRLAKGSALTVRSAPFGDNLALARSGAIASASSEAKNRPASNANDGLWELWEKAADLPARTTWQSARKNPTPAEPDTLTITFPSPRNIDRIVALCYLPAVNPSPRDFQFQVDVAGQWRTVASGQDEYTWVLHRQFPPVTTRKIRLLVTRINDGWHADRRWMHILMGPQPKNYTDSQLMVAELEAYGPTRGQ